MKNRKMEKDIKYYEEIIAKINNVIIMNEYVYYIMLFNNECYIIQKRDTKYIFMNIEKETLEYLYHNRELYIPLIIVFVNEYEILEYFKNHIV